MNARVSTLRSGCVLLTIYSLAACAALATTLAGQQRDAPSAAPQRGTATIAGRVVDDGSGEPIRRAIVTLRGPGLPPTRSIVTDDEGRFALRNLPAGRYSLVATKAAYLEAAYGARRPGRPGGTIQVQEGTQMTNAVLRMARGGVLEGTIRDEAGAALPGVSLFVFDPRAPGNLGSGTFTSGQISAVTDDRGQYRFFGLQPGDYVIAALLSPGGAGEISRMGEADVDARLAALERSRTAAPGRSPSDVPARAAVVGYAPVFYPGTATFARATTIQLVAGQERVGLDFTLDAVPTVSIAGTVSRADGQLPAGVRLSYVADGPRVFLNSGGPMLTGPDAEGRFHYTSVPPGHYTIYARSDSTAAAPAGPIGGRGAPAPVVAGIRLFARTDVDVAGGNLSGIALELRPGVSVSGRVVFDAASSEPPLASTQVQVRLSVPGGDWSAGSGSAAAGTSLFTPPVASAAPGAAFAVTNVGPGPYRLSSVIPGAAAGRWWLRSATFGDRDLLDEMLDVSTEPIDGIVLTFTDKPTEIVGTLQTAAGIAAPEYSLVLFPADRALWQPGSRRIKSTRSGSDGQFTLANVPGGSYLLGALMDFEPADLERVEFLTELAAVAVRVTLRDGERTVQDVRVAR